MPLDCLWAFGIHNFSYCLGMGWPRSLFIAVICMTDTAGVTDGHFEIIIFNFFLFCHCSCSCKMKTVLKASSRQSPAHMRNHRNAVSEESETNH